MGNTTTQTVSEVHYQNHSNRKKRPTPLTTAPVAPESESVPSAKPVIKESQSQPHKSRKAGSTTTIPKEYEPQSNDTVYNLKRNRGKLQQQIEDLKNTNNELQTQLNAKQKTVKDKTIETLQGTIRNLRSDLSHAQQTILSMTSIVDVSQKMPTVDELLMKFQSIRDQQHADICTTLKRLIKTQYPKWQKYYIAQLVHKFTFNGLITTYNTVKKYKATLYDKVADELNMRYVMRKSMNDDENVNAEDIEYEMHRVLGNMFGAYFKNNFEFILKRDKVLNDIMNSLGTMWTEVELDEMNENDIEQVRGYIGHCCDICWIMMLQDPVLQFHPMEWKCKETVVYSEELHRKVVGSDRKATHVLYYVWPVMSRKNEICGNYKMDVVVKDNFYGKIKEKRRKSSQNREEEHNVNVPDVEEHTVNNIAVDEDHKAGDDQNVSANDWNVEPRLVGVSISIDCDGPSDKELMNRVVNEENVQQPKNNDSELCNKHNTSADDGNAPQNEDEKPQISENIESTNQSVDEENAPDL